MARAPTYTPGRYWGKLTNQQLGKTKTDKPQIILSFQIMGRIDPADPDGDLISCNEYERSVFRVITENTLEYAMKDLATLSFTGDSLSQIGLDHPHCVDMRGTETALSCDHEEYPAGSGKIKERWEIAREGGSLQVKPLDEKEKRTLDTLFGRKLKKQSAGILEAKKVQEVQEAENAAGAASLTPETIATETAGNTDDVPF